MNDHMKILMFECWCPKCIHKKEKETEEPCNECLYYPAVDDEETPLHFKEDK